MAGTKSKFVGGSLNFYDKTHNPSFPVGMWADCPLNAIAADPSVGFVFFEDFTGPMQGDATATTNLDGWTCTQSTTGAVNMLDEAGGILEIDSASATVTQGLNVQATESVIFTPAADKDIWFETRVRVDEALTAELFFGLSVADTSIIATSANSSANHIGWQCVTDDGVLLFSAEKAGAGATKSSNTLVEDTFVRLGFKVNGVTDIEFWVDDAKQSTTHVTANIPIVAMCPSFVCQSDGSQDPIVGLDYVKCVQLR
jgi:hypothetical protein